MSAFHNKWKYSTIILGVVFAFSLLVNIAITGYLLQRYGFEGALDRVSEISGVPEIPATREPYRMPVIPEIYLKNQEFVTLGFDKHVKDKDDVAAWQQLIRSKVKEIYLPDFEKLAGPAKPVVTDRQDLGFGTLTQYSLTAFDGDNIVFFELIPKDDSKATTDPNGSKKYPAVLFLPGSGSQGARDILNIPSELTAEYYHGGVGLEVAKAGYAVYVIEHRGYGLRSIEVNDACEMRSQSEARLRCSAEILSLHLAMTDTSLGSLQMADAIQVLNYIRSLNYVDEKRDAVAGISLGGALASYISLIDQNLTATVLASGIGSVAEGFSLGTIRDNLRYFDGADILAALVPNQVYISYGNQEYGMFRFEAETSYTYHRALKAYEMFDSEDNLVFVAHEGSHEFDIPSLVSFLNHTLG